MKTDLFQPCGHCWVFQICWHVECSTFTASSFIILNSSTGIPSQPLALFIEMLPKAHLTSYSKMSDSRSVITPLWLSGSLRSFSYSSSVYSCQSFINYNKIEIFKTRKININKYVYIYQFSSVQSLSHVWLCNPMNWSTPGFPVHHQLQEFTQTHVHPISDVIQPSHPLFSPSPLAFDLSQHRGLFQ